jgi:hypothetical protein
MDPATNALLERLRKGRELRVEVPSKYDPGKTITFVCRRPTDVEGTDLVARRAQDSEIARDYVVGWGENVTENDVDGDGSDYRVKFDPAIWREWCADWGACWDPIATAVLAAWRKKSKLFEENEKN